MKDYDNKIMWVVATKRNSPFFLSMTFSKKDTIKRFLDITSFESWNQAKKKHFKVVKLDVNIRPYYHVWK